MNMTKMNLHHRRHQERLLCAIRRDVTFVFLGAIAYFIVAYIETRADDVEIRKGPLVRYFDRRYTTDHAGDNYNCSIQKLVAEECHSSFSQHNLSCESKNDYYNTPTGIIDAGFILTSPIHRYLAKHRQINDVLAMMNSAFLVLPLSYVFYNAFWKGDFRLSFRLIATHLFRSLCGWFT